MKVTFTIPQAVLKHLIPTQVTTLTQVNIEDAWNANKNVDELAALGRKTYAAPRVRGGRSRGWNHYYQYSYFGNRISEFISGMQTTNSIICVPVSFKQHETINGTSWPPGTRNVYIVHDGPGDITIFFPKDINANYEFVEIRKNGMRPHNVSWSNITQGAPIATEAVIRKAFLSHLAKLRKEIKSNPELQKEVESHRGAKKMVEVVAIAQDLMSCKGTIEVLVEGIQKESLTKQSLDKFFSEVAHLARRKGEIRRNLAKYYGK